MLIEHGVAYYQNAPTCEIGKNAQTLLYQLFSSKYRLRLYQVQGEGGESVLVSTS
jgi:hypothetical protein